MPHGNCWTSSGDVKGAGPTWSQAKSLRTVGPARSGSLLLRTTRQTASSARPATSNSDEPQHKRNAPLLLGGGAGLEGGASTPVFPPPARCPRPRARTFALPPASDDCGDHAMRNRIAARSFALLPRDRANSPYSTQIWPCVSWARCQPLARKVLDALHVGPLHASASSFRISDRCGGAETDCEDDVRVCSCWLPCQLCRLNARPPPQDATGFTAAGFLNKCDRKSG